MNRLSGLPLRPETIEIVDSQYHRLLGLYGPNGDTPKTYHNATHAINVARTAGRIAVVMGKPEGFVNDIVVAAMFHDDIQGFGHGEDERQSAENAVKAVRGYDYFTGKHQQRIYDAIMATVIDLDSFEQSPTTEAGKVLADADLASLGAEAAVYNIFSDKLFREFNPGEPKISEAMHRFLGGSVRLLTNHSYYTEAARLLLPHQEENLELTKRRQDELGAQLSL